MIFEEYSTIPVFAKSNEYDDAATPVLTNDEVHVLRYAIFTTLDIRVVLNVLNKKLEIKELINVELIIVEIFVFEVGVIKSNRKVLFKLLVT